MGHDVNHTSLGEGRQTNRCPHVIGKDQEGGTVGNQAAVQVHAVEDSTHTVLTHTKAEVTPCVGTRLKIRQTFHVGHVGVSQIRRTTQQFGHYGRKSIQGCFGELPGRIAQLGDRGKGFLPALRQLTGHHALKFSRFGGVGRFVGCKALVPFGLCCRPLINRLTEVGEHIIRHIEGWLCWPAEGILGQGNFIGTQGRTVGTFFAGFVG